MRIVIPLTGSRGDIQPYVALAVGLQGAGHEVCIVTHEDFEAFIRGRGLGFVGAGGHSQQLHHSETGRRMFGAGGNAFVYLREFVRLREPYFMEMTEGILHACRNADLVMLTQTVFLMALSVAEKLRLPTCAATYLPSTPTRTMACWLFPDVPSWLPGHSAYRMSTFLAAGAYLWHLLRPILNRVRRELLDVPPLPWLMPQRLFGDFPTLHGYSTCVAPRPRDWPADHHVTGYWFLDRDPSWRPSPALVDFLEAGPPPVCVGFGSLPDHDPAALTEMVTAALDRVGCRGILLTGWGALEAVDGSDRLFVTRNVPHDWLFPRTAAVVHHGGAGTTAAGLRAGVPSVLVPYAVDQPFWGRRVAALGAGPAPIPRRRLTVERLAAALQRALGDGDMRRRASALGERLRAEDGVGEGVRIFEQFAARIERRGASRDAVPLRFSGVSRQHDAGFRSSLG